VGTSGIVGAVKTAPNTMGATFPIYARWELPCRLVEIGLTSRHQRAAELTRFLPRKKAWAPI